MESLAKINYEIDQYEENPTRTRYVSLVQAIHKLPKRESNLLLKELREELDAENFDPEYSSNEDFQKIQQRLDILLDAGVVLPANAPDEFKIWEEIHDEKLRHEVTVQKAYTKLAGSILGRQGLHEPGLVKNINKLLVHSIPTYRKGYRSYSMFKK